MLPHHRQGHADHSVSMADQKHIALVRIRQQTSGLAGSHGGFFTRLRVSWNHGRLIGRIHARETSAEFLERQEPGSFGEPIRIQPFAEALLDLHREIHGLRNEMSRFNRAQERGRKDMLNAFIAKAYTRFPGLDDTIRRKMGVVAFPGRIKKVNPGSVSANPDNLTSAILHFFPSSSRATSPARSSSLASSTDSIQFALNQPRLKALSRSPRICFGMTPGFSCG